MSEPTNLLTTLPHINNLVRHLRRNGFPEALVAGGALRDLLNHKPIKDVDVFVQGRTKDVFDAVDRLLGQRTTIVGCVDPGQLQTDEAYRRAFDGVVGVAEYSGFSWSLPTVQVIALGNEVTPAAVLERIDFGICRVATDGTEIIYHPAYHQDRWNQTFTLLRCDYLEQYERSMKRWERLAPKYPGWTLKVPERFQVLPDHTEFMCSASEVLG